MSFKRRVRAALDHAAGAVGLLAAFERRRNGLATVLMHHRVLPAGELRDYPFPSLALDVELFEREVEWLAAHCELRTVSEAITRDPSGARPVVAISFDDGYRDNLEHAAPILERHGARATFYVTTDFVSGASAMWYDRAAVAIAAVSDSELESAARAHGVEPQASGSTGGERIRAWVEALKRASSAARLAFVAQVEHAAPSGVLERELARFTPLSPGDVRDLARRGHEVGAHSISHEILPLCDDAALDREVRGSREIVAEWTGASVGGFCYPNGSHDLRVVEAVRRAGYTHACTTLPPFGAGDLDPLRIPRIDVTRERVTDASGRFDPLALRAELCGFHEALR